MFGMSGGRRAMFHAAERSAIILLRRSAAWNFPIAEFFRLCGGSVAVAFGNRAWRDGLPHIAAKLVVQCRARIRHTLTMPGIMCPNRVAMHIGDVARIEVVLMNERVVDNHGMVAPAGMPSPTAPSVPTSA